MKLVAAIIADGIDSPSGLKNRIYEQVGGTSIIRHLMKSVCDSGAFDSVVAITRKEHEKQLQQEAEGLPVRIKTIKWNDLPYRNTVRAARKWASRNWSGGLWDTFCWDEEGPLNTLKDIYEEEQADKIVKLSGHTPCFDPDLLKELIAQMQEREPEMEWFLPLLPSGFCYQFYWGNLLQELARANALPRNLFRYDPPTKNNPRGLKRLLFTFKCVFVPEEKYLLHPMRFLADSQRNLEMMRNLYDQYGEEFLSWGLDETTTAYIEDRRHFFGRLPQEIDIEITTRVPFESTMHTRPQRAKAVQDMSFENFCKIIDDCTDYDDILLTLSGFGDPLMHPDLLQFIDYAKAKGIFGINIVTYGKDMVGDLAEQLAASEVDVITYMLDANTEESYRDLTGQDDFKITVKNIETFYQRREDPNKRHPFQVLEFTKAKRTFKDMENFFEKWQLSPPQNVPQQDVCIRGFNNRSGQVPDDSIHHLTPGKRRLCDSLQLAMTIFVDGSVPICKQDFECKHPIGNAFASPVADLWHHQTMTSLRQDQFSGQFDTGPYCKDCKSWQCL